MIRRPFLPVLALAAAFCAGCSGVRSVGKGQRLVAPSDPALVYQGRWDLSDPQHPQASWPGFGIETDFSGSRIAARLRDAGNYYNVFVDDRLHAVVGGGTGKWSDYELATGLSSGTHRVRLQRRNISFEQPTRFEGFVVDSNAVVSLPPVSTRRRIEIIGDSFTAAEGNEASAPTLAWKAKYPVTNFNLGYASLVAKELDADLTAVCRSGSGVVCDYTGLREHPLPERYGWTLMEDPSIPWSSSGPAPDLVIVSLGLNDHSGLMKADGRVPDAASAEFRSGYRSFLAQVRGHYPDAQIVVLASYLPWARENLRRVVDEEASPKVHYAEFDNFPDSGYVADGHPTLETHRRMAAQVVDQLRKLGLAPEKQR